MRIRDLEDKMMKEIGIRREEIYKEMSDRSVEEKKRIIREIDIERMRMEEERKIC